mmetsp:Transcript_32562/g.59871  ORF Transcript_32562/g.59871 Transcript_32562/m.59871 type:complete len:227 (-) Transcript_32562:322-1002(-)
MFVPRPPVLHRRPPCDPHRRKAPSAPAVRSPELPLPPLSLSELLQHSLPPLPLRDVPADPPRPARLPTPHRPGPPSADRSEQPDGGETRRLSLPHGPRTGGAGRLAEVEDVESCQLPEAHRRGRGERQPPGRESHEFKPRRMPMRDRPIPRGDFEPEAAGTVGPDPVRFDHRRRPRPAGRSRPAGGTEPRVVPLCDGCRNRRRDLPRWQDPTTEGAQIGEMSPGDR